MVKSDTYYKWISGMMTWDSDSHLFPCNTIGQPATPTRKLVIPDSSSPAPSEEKARFAVQAAWWSM